MTSSQNWYCQIVCKHAQTHTYPKKRAYLSFSKPIMQNKNLFKRKQRSIITMNKWIKLLLGLILIVVPIALIFPGMPLASWGSSAITVLKGGITWIVILAGLLLVILGISELKE